MRKNLNMIASIQMGYSFRARIEVARSGTVSIIQMKNLTSENLVGCTDLTRIDLDHLKKHHLVKPGDLVFRSRGLVSMSALLADDPGVAVVAAPLFRIRVTNPGVLPEYLNWFINQARAQAYLSRQAKGTAQKMIGKQVLEDLEVFIPSIERQKTIVGLASLAVKEQRLMEKLIRKRRQQVSSILIKSAQRGNA